ncbi:hypothetical protein Tco_0964147 [Tanacetum coccineum]
MYPIDGSFVIRHIFLDGYGVLVVRTIIFKYLRLSSRMRLRLGKFNNCCARQPGLDVATVDATPGHPMSRVWVWYVIEVATLRALVRAGDKTSGDASAGRPAAASRGRGTGGRAGSGSGRTRGRSGDQGDWKDWEKKIWGQLQNLLPTIVAQVGDQGRGQGNGRNQNGDAVNDNIPGDHEHAGNESDLQLE